MEVNNMVDENTSVNEETDPSRSQIVISQDNTLKAGDGRERLPFSPDETVERLQHVLRMLESITDSTGKPSVASPLPMARVYLRGIIGCGIAGQRTASASALSTTIEQQGSVPPSPDSSELVSESSSVWETVLRIVLDVRHEIEAESGNAISGTAEMHAYNNQYKGAVRVGRAIEKAKSISAGSESAEPIEVSALRLFKAFQRGGTLDMAQAVAHLMEVYYSHNETLVGEAVTRLEILAGMSDQEWPAISGGDAE